MPRPGDSPRRTNEFLRVPNMTWLDEALGGGLARGGVYVNAGEPGVGKSTLLVQALGELALGGVRVLYVTNEQSVDEIEANLHRLFARNKKQELPPAIRENFFFEDRVRDVGDLPRFLTRQVLPHGQEYHGVEVLVFDSVQGRGLSAGDAEKFRALYEFTEIAKADGLVTFLVGHVNKAGQIAGPRTFEHNVDCVLYMRKAFSLRLLFVPKNRFGPSVLDPIALVMGEGGLAPSPRENGRSSSALGYAGHSPELAEVQASVGFSGYGVTPKLNAPSLPKPKVSQLLKVLGRVEGVDLSELAYEVNAYVPDRRGYAVELDLPLAVTLLSSYAQQPVPSNTLFVGEIDLMGRVRPPKPDYLDRLAGLLVEQKGRIHQIWISRQVAEEYALRPVGESGRRLGAYADVYGADDLDALMGALWPDLFERV